MADTARARGELAPPRGLFTFLKNAALLPVCSFRLFALLSTLSTASNTAIFLLESLTSDHEPSLCLELADIAHAAFPPAVKIAIVSTTIASCSGERPTMASCLGKVINGDVLGSSMVNAVLVSDSVTEAAFLVAIFVFLVVCSVAGVVAAAEPGRGGHSALVRAWRLVREKKTQAALCAAATWLLDAAARKWLHALGIMWSPTSAVGRIVYICICHLAMNAVHVLTVVVCTAYYLECRMSEENKEGHEHEE